MCAKCIVARRWIATCEPYGIAEGGRDRAPTHSAIEQPIVGGWRRKLDIASWDGSWLTFTDVGVGGSIGATSRGLPHSPPSLLRAGGAHYHDANSKEIVKRIIIEARESVGVA